MARPSSLTDDLALRIAEVLEEGNSIADACALAGIAESTYHEWVRRGDAGDAPYDAFAELARQARARGRQVHVVAIKAAAADDWRASAFFLERSDPAHWGRKDQVKADHIHSGPGGGPIEIDVSKLSDDQLRAIVEGKGGG